MAPHGTLRLVALAEHRAEHGGADVDHVLGRHAVAHGLALGHHRVVIEGDLALRKELTAVAAAGIHGNVALVQQALVPVEAVDGRLAVDGHAAVLPENAAAEGPQPGHEVARASGVLGGQDVGNQRFVQGLDVGHAGLKLLDGGGNGVPPGSCEQFGVIDHADGRHGPGQAKLLAVDAAGGQRGFLEVFLEVVLAQNLGPVGEHARLGHGVEDADIGLGDVELFPALHADEQLLGGVGPGPAHPGNGVAGFGLVGVHHLLEDVLGGFLLAGPTGPDDVGALRHSRGRG